MASPWPHMSTSLWDVQVGVDAGFGSAGACASGCALVAVRVSWILSPRSSTCCCCAAATMSRNRAGPGLPGANVRMGRGGMSRHGGKCQERVQNAEDVLVPASNAPSLHWELFHRHHFVVVVIRGVGVVGVVVVVVCCCVWVVVCGGVRGCAGVCGCVGAMRLHPALKGLQWRARRGPECRHGVGPLRRPNRIGACDSARQRATVTDATHCTGAVQGHAWRRDWPGVLRQET